jgi:hypothetical protein
LTSAPVARRAIADNNAPTPSYWTRWRGLAKAVMSAPASAIGIGRALVDLELNVPSAARLFLPFDDRNHSRLLHMTGLCSVTMAFANIIAGIWL